MCGLTREGVEIKLKLFVPCCCYPCLVLSSTPSVSVFFLTLSPPPVCFRYPLFFLSVCVSACASVYVRVCVWM